jgi:uncharacterized radical SAM superfamily protein
MGKEVKLQKIPLEAFIEALVQLYENGANFVDIIGIPDVDQDIIGLAVKNEYLVDLEEDDDDDEEEYKIKKQVMLTDDDITRLTEN